MTDLRDKINKLKLQAQTTPLGTTCDTRLLFEILDEVEQCSNANPNEALECLNKIVESFNETTTGMYGLGEVVVANDLIYDFEEELDTIKQALIKAQEQEKVLDILKSKKYIPLDRLNPRFWNNKETYNEVVNYEYYLWLCKEVCPYVVKEEQKLTQEEFNSTKEMFTNEN